jgi:hypothetical protein
MAWREQEYLLGSDMAMSDSAKQARVARLLFRNAIIKTNKAFKIRRNVMQTGNAFLNLQDEKGFYGWMLAVKAEPPLIELPALPKRSTNHRQKNECCRERG